MSNYYRNYSSDEGIGTDSLLRGRFDSSDVYAAIKVGNTYTFTVGGSRNEFMSWYPNIYEYELIEKE